MSGRHPDGVRTQRPQRQARTCGSASFRDAISISENSRKASGSTAAIRAMAQEMPRSYSGESWQASR